MDSPDNPTSPRRDSRLVTFDPLRAISQSWERTTSTTGGFLTATLLGWFVQFLYGLSTQPTILGAVRVFSLLWFASGAAFFVGTIGGFLFGVPKVRTISLEPVGQHDTPPRPPPPDEISVYRDNTNLEEVSDWLTKIIIGIGLAQFREIGSAVLTIGDRIGSAIDQHGDLGGNVIAIASLIMGFFTGFLYYYVWARMTLRRSLIHSLGVK
jgi:hypothetical protein